MENISFERDIEHAGAGQVERPSYAGAAASREHGGGLDQDAVELMLDEEACLAGPPYVDFVFIGGWRR